MEIVKKRNKEKCWDILSFFISGREIGSASIEIYRKEVFIWNIESYERGAGTKMINYIKSLKGIATIKGDVGNESHIFWEKMGAEIKGDEFAIRCE
ncbi:hypothetical protein [Bacillus cereus group sp. MG11]|uniref:hypothetical protein n=1 Tax=Bacillus cereus group sp. MG11 TaxID=3040248 RepID=UPI003399168D